MADKTSIEWTATVGADGTVTPGATWNPITGCAVVSPGCTNCYAMKLAGTRLRNHPSRAGLTKDTKAGPVWTGEMRLNRQWLSQPLDWRRARRIFVCAHGDLFAEGVPDEWILDVFTVMAIADRHTFQVLTKRPDRARDFLTEPDRLNDIYANWYTFSGKPAEVYSWPLHNVWVGASAEDQQRYDSRRIHLDEVPAAKRFWSLEPLLGRVDLKLDHARPDWIIVGGESGPAARPMHPDWARSIRDQCSASGVPFFFKQWGEWGEDSGPLTGGKDPVMEGRAECATWDGERWQIWRDGYEPPVETATPWLFRLGKKRTGRLLDEREHSEFPQVPA